MKKLAVLLLASSLLLSSPAQAFDIYDTPIFETPMPVTVNTNGALIASDADPKVINGRTLLPLRAAAEALDAQVIWNEAAKQATITKDNTTLVFTVNKKSFTKNGQTIALDVPLSTYRNRIYLPIRAFSEALNIQTNWDSKYRIVSLGETTSPSERKLYQRDASPLPAKASLLIDKYTPNPSDDPLVGTWISQNEYDTTFIKFIHPLKNNTYKVITMMIGEYNTDDYESIIIDLWYGIGTRTTKNTLTLNQEETVQYAYGPGHGPDPTMIKYYSITDGALVEKSFVDVFSNKIVKSNTPPFYKL